ncbi:hypothetical protein [Streptomyces mirabilis]|uniref:hypothetical protein n=1 Tax=Streptomyces mirabilis TaxID=68239 RepID=UPI00331B59C1
MGPFSRTQGHAPAGAVLLAGEHGRLARRPLSVSAWLSRAAEHAAKIEAWPAAAAEAMAYVDPPTPDEQAWVDDFMNRVTQPTHTAEQSQGAA